MGVAAIALYVVVTTPSLRRASGRLLKYGLFTAAPTYLWQEVTRAWAESAPANREPEPWNAGKPAIIDG